MPGPWPSSSRRALQITASAGIVACGAARLEHTTPAATGPVTDAGDAATIALENTPDAAPQEKDAFAPRVPCGYLRWAPGFCYLSDPGGPQPAPYTDVEPWLATHGAKPGDVKAEMRVHLLGSSCRPLTAGPANEDVLLCMYHAYVSVEPSVYRAVQRARVVAVRHGGVAVLLDAPISFANFDAPAPLAEGDETDIFGLQIDARDAATKIVLSEPRPGACAAATRMSSDEITARLREKPVVPLEIETMRLDAKILRTICSAAKAYTWTRGSYRGP
jgi:hypothetical protein